MSHQIAVRPPATRATVRRRLRHTGELPGGFETFEIKSRTHEDARWHPVVDVETGRVTCDCPHAQYRLTASKLGHAPTVADYPVLCHHLQRVINWVLRHEGGDQ